VHDGKHDITTLEIQLEASSGISLTHTKVNVVAGLGAVEAKVSNMRAVTTFA
jgi:hypothetical protein